MSLLKLKDKFASIITPSKKVRCKEMIEAIRFFNNSLQTNPTGAALAEYLNTTQPEVRKTIQLIRENNSKFSKTTFIVASQSGYYLTNNKALIKKWADKQHKRVVSGLQQVNEAWLITKKGWQ